MEYLVWFVGLLMIGFATYQIYMIRKSGEITDDGWQEIKSIAYSTVENLMQLYDVKNDKDEFINFVIDSIRVRILESENLSEIDRAFWTEDRLRSIFQPVIEGFIEKVEKVETL